MITFKFNGQELKIPSSWEDPTFKQYIDLMDMKDDLYFLLSVFTGVPEETWRNPKTLVSGLDQVLESLQFLQEPPNFTEFKGKVGPYVLPKDITMECPAQFEDMRQIRNKPGTEKEQTERFAHYIAIYCQKLRDGEYDNVKAESMIPEIMNCKASEVMTAGAFFFVRLSNTRRSTMKTSLTNSMKQKNTRSVLMSFIKDLARRLRLTGFHVKQV